MLSLCRTGYKAKLIVLLQSQTVNFMIVGGIGYIINMGLYWWLCHYFNSQVAFLGQQFYLVPFVASSAIAMVSNYELNKIWTFRKWTEQKLGAARYFSMGTFTILIDMCFLFLLVQYLSLPPVPAAAIAILIVFAMRYTIARKWIWSRARPPLS